MRYLASAVIESIFPLRLPRTSLFHHAVGETSADRRQEACCTMTAWDETESRNPCILISGANVKILTKPTARPFGFSPSLTSNLLYRKMKKMSIIRNDEREWEEKIASVLFVEPELKTACFSAHTNAPG